MTDIFLDAIYKTPVGKKLARTRVYDEKKTGIKDQRAQIPKKCAMEGCVPPHATDGLNEVVTAFGKRGREN